MAKKKISYTVSFDFKEDQRLQALAFDAGTTVPKIIEAIVCIFPQNNQRYADLPLVQLAKDVVKLVKSYQTSKAGNLDLDALGVARQLRDKGLSFTAIGLHLNVHRSTVQRALTRTAQLRS